MNISQYLFETENSKKRRKRNIKIHPFSLLAFCKMRKHYATQETLATSQNVNLFFISFKNKMI